MRDGWACREEGEAQRKEQRRWYSTRRRKPIWIEAKPEGISTASMEEEGNDDCDTFNDQETMIIIEIMQGVTTVCDRSLISNVDVGMLRYWKMSVPLIEKLRLNSTL